MKCKIYPSFTLGTYEFVVIISIYNGKIMLSRHKQRNTWETQGGHIEIGETPLEAAKRELYEESGAVEYQINPAFDYQIAGESTDSNGMVFRAEIYKLNHLPDSEIGEISFFEQLPENLTYPEITPVLFENLDGN